MCTPSSALRGTLSLLVAVVGTGVSRAAAADPAFDAAEARTALKAALAQNTELLEKLAQERSANNAMAVKVGVLSAAAESAQADLAEMRRRAEALGPATDTRGLEQRVLDSVNDLRLTREAQTTTEARLMQLAEAAQAYLAAAPDQAATLKAPLEAALASALDPATHVAPTPSTARIETSRVVSVKPDQRLLVVNAGRQAGLKPGTPLRIFRNDRPLASAVVVEVRSALSGTLITQLEGEEFPRVGDTLRLLSDAR
jgi:hypothetical protein